MCSLFRAKCFTWILSVGHILVLALRFDRVFVMTFQRHGLVRGKNGARFEFNSVFNEGLRLDKCSLNVLNVLVEYP